MINVNMCLVCFLLNCTVLWSLKRYASHLVELYTNYPSSHPLCISDLSILKVGDMSEYDIYTVFQIEKNVLIVYFVYVIVNFNVFITKAVVSDDPLIIKTLSLLGELHFEILYYLVMF